MGDIASNFVNYIIKTIHNSKGQAAALKRADNPATEYQSWDILATFGIDLEYAEKRLPFTITAAAIAKSKPQTNGNISIGKALAISYEEGSQSNQAKAKLRRILACDNTQEVCQVLRQVLQLVRSKCSQTLDYAALLNDLSRFRFDDSRQKVKAKWAQEFYKKEQTQRVVNEQ